VKYVRAFKNFKIGLKWKTIILENEDIEKVRQELRGRNQDIMLQCLSDAKKMEGVGIGIASDIAMALFSKLADQQFTRVQSKLDELMQEERDKAEAF